MHNTSWDNINAVSTEWNTIIIISKVFAFNLLKQQQQQQQQQQHPILLCIYILYFNQLIIFKKKKGFIFL